MDEDELYELREGNKASKKKRRAGMDEDELNELREGNKASKKKRRDDMDEDGRDELREDNRFSKEKSWAEMGEDEHERLRKNNKASKKKRRAGLDEDELNELREGNKASKKKRRAGMDEDELNELRKANKAYKRMLWDDMDEDGRDELREDNRFSKEKCWAEMDEDERGEFREGNRFSKEKRWIEMDEDERNELRERNRKSKQRRWETLDDDQRSALKERNRLLKKKRRAEMSESELRLLRMSERLSKQRRWDKMSEDERDMLRCGNRISKKKQWDSLTNEEKEAKRTYNRVRIRQLRENNDSVADCSTCSFIGTKLWEKPCMDSTFCDYRRDPEVSTLLWYANNGSWMDREAKWLVAFLHAVEYFEDRVAENDGDTLTVEQKKELQTAETALDRLQNLYAQSVTHEVSLCQIVFETFDREILYDGKVQDIWHAQLNWQEKEQLNDFEVSALFWFATVPREITPEVTPSDNIYDIGIDESWARKVVVNDPPKNDGDVVVKKVELEVPGHWWPGWSSDWTKYPGSIVGFDPSDEFGRYFLLELDDKKKYPGRFHMTYKEVLKYSLKGLDGENELPQEPVKVAPVDHAFRDLCRRTEDDLGKTVFQEYRKADDPKGIVQDRVKISCLHAEERIKQIIDKQRVTPDMQKVLGEKFLEAQGRGCYWGKKDFPVNETLFESKKKKGGDGIGRDGVNPIDTSVDAPLHTCAACGYRQLSIGNEKYYDIELSQLKCLKLNNDQRKAHIDCMNEPPLEIPINESGDESKLVEPWRAYSVWPAMKESEIVRIGSQYQLCDMQFEHDKDGKLLYDEDGQRIPSYYHLHPEFVDERYERIAYVGPFVDPFSFYAKLCSSCHSFIEQKNKEEEEEEKKKMKKIEAEGGVSLEEEGDENGEIEAEKEFPPRSIASGVDLGCHRRIGLETLTLRERQIIAKVRHYYNVIKIESNTGEVREHSHSALKGCGILFDHDSPQVVAKLLETESINGSISIQFVDSEGKYDRLAQKALGSSNVSGRAYVIYQWLVVLQKINWIYENDDELPAYEDFRKMIDECNQSLVEESIKTASEGVEKQANIMRDDTAQVRATSARPAGSSAHEEEAGDSEFPLRCCYVTSSRKTAYDRGTDSTHDYLCDAAFTIGVDVRKQMGSYRSVQSFRGQDPLNEFLSGDDGLVKAFPDVFLFGSAYPHKKRPSLAPNDIDHLLMQYTTTAASCQPLLFYLFDQKQRHGTIKSMYAKALSNEQDFDRFVSDYMSDDFQQKLQEAVLRPHSSSAKHVLGKLVPVLTGGSKKTVFGALERNENAGKIMALGRRFGSAPAFLTFAIDDVNHPTSLRLAVRSASNHEYPAVLSGCSYEALKRGFGRVVGEGGISIPNTWAKRAKLLSQNPVGAACVYKGLVLDVLSIIIGKEPMFDDRRKDRTKLVSFEDITSGMIGTSLAYFGVTETTGRGSLHFHVVLWGGMSPDILEAISDLKRLCTYASSVLDSMYGAQLDRHFHVRDLVSKDMKLYCNESLGLSGNTGVPRAMMLPPDPIGEREEFLAHSAVTVCYCGIHGHSFTCRKPPKGYHGCRLCKPSGLRATTVPVWLVANSDDFEPDVSYEVIEQEGMEPSYVQHIHPSDYLFPVASADQRTVVWELQRKKLDPLEVLDKSDSKGDVILRLHDQMNPETSISPVIVDPAHDGNCLFEALWRGLELLNQAGLFQESKLVKQDHLAKSGHELREQLVRHFKRNRKNCFSISVVRHHFEGWVDKHADQFKHWFEEKHEKLVKYPYKTKKNGQIDDEEEYGHLNDDDKKKLKKQLDELWDGFRGAKKDEYKLQFYEDKMGGLSLSTCYAGGWLEIYLFAHLHGVNVATHRDDYSRDSLDVLVEEDKQNGVFVANDAPTVHLHFVGDHYKLLRYDWTWPEFKVEVEEKRRQAVKNSLFLALLQSLQEVDPDRTICPKTVGDLRRCLVRYLKDENDMLFQRDPRAKQSLDEWVERRNESFEAWFKDGSYIKSLVAEYPKKKTEAQKRELEAKLTALWDGFRGEMRDEYFREFYSQIMMNADPCTCEPGDWLEMFLFAHCYGVNVALHRNDYSDDVPIEEDKNVGVLIDEYAPTVHLSVGDGYYTLLQRDWSWSTFLAKVKKGRRLSPNHRGPLASDLESKEDYQKFILRKEVWKITEVDSYKFTEDGNGLFYNLAQGLALLSSNMKPNEVSVSGLRSDLAQYLMENGSQLFDDESEKTLHDKANEIQHEYDEYMLKEECQGGELELHLFARAMKINIALYKKDRESLVREEFISCGDGCCLNMLHLLCSKKNGAVRYSLFMPKLYTTMIGLCSMETEDLQSLIKRVAKELPQRNGMVVDFNPLLTSLLGCNTNLLFLGAKEQSKGALFYIGPYINKNGVQVIDALSLLVQAQEHALRYPSVAEDSGSESRFVRHVLSRVLNKMNSLMEISDTQAASALLGWRASICSEAFSYYGAEQYKNYVTDCCDLGGDGGELPKVNLDFIDDVDSGDEFSDENCSDIGSSDESDDGGSESDSTDQSIVSSNDDGVSMTDMLNSIYSRDESALGEPKLDYISIESDEANDSIVTGGSITCSGEGSEQLDCTGVETSESNTSSQSEKEEGCSRVESGEKENLQDVNATAHPADLFEVTYDSRCYGAAALYKMGKKEDPQLYPVRYPELYRYRGKDLKYINRFEYEAVVVVMDGKVEGRENERGPLGPKPVKPFHFGRGLRERIGKEYYLNKDQESAGECKWYFQALRMNQCTPRLSRSPPPAPGRKPTDETEAEVWKKRADRFAFFYLLMFRPEERLYEACGKCENCRCNESRKYLPGGRRMMPCLDDRQIGYKYDWDEFVKFVNNLRKSDRAIDRSRLELMERMIHGWRVDLRRREMLSDYRGRNRTIWNDEEKALARAENGSGKTKCTFSSGGDDDMDFVDVDCRHKQLSLGMQTKVMTHVLHSNELVDAFNKTISQTESGMSRGLNNTRNIPFVSGLADQLIGAQPSRDDEPLSVVDTAYPLNANTRTRVDRYLAKQQLSDDKMLAVGSMRDHLEAVDEGRFLDEKYHPPFLLICGGPGNGKSKLVETLDGMADAIRVGKPVKSAFLGIAAVNIAGSSLCDIFDIPTEFKGASSMDRIMPWGDRKLQRFKLKYDIEKVNCIVVDEISTVKPYVLNYLDARLRALFPERKKRFGGLMVVMLGDFDQLPPVGGWSLAKSAMKYMESTFQRRRNTIGLSNESGSEFSNTNIAGMKLFKDAVYIKLTQQHRSKDPEHTALLNKMSTTGSISVKDLKQYKLLSEEDMTDEAGFRFATIIVTGNRERLELNASQAQKWAGHYQTNVVRWFRKFKKWEGRPRTQENQARAMKENCFYEMFVPGAPGFLTHNINTDIGLANGVEIKYHSVSFEDTEDEALFVDMMRNIAPGGTITLPRPPSTVNVELFADFPGDSREQKKKNMQSRKKWTHGSMTSDGTVVIPISTKSGSFIKDKKEYVKAGGEFGYAASTITARDWFPIEPGFSVTVYKVSSVQRHSGCWRFLLCS